MGVKVEEEGSMEEGIAPERGRGGGVSEETAGDLSDFANAAFCNAVLLWGVGKSVGLLDAMGGAVVRESAVEEFASPIRVEAADGTFEVGAALLCPVNDNGRRLVFGVEEENGGVAAVIVNKNQHVAMALA
ncbi:unnamed protein product [Closterium sp. Yama58-4]|nr:unnamed protein product [Closterium sp. Yama58-4]